MFKLQLSKDSVNTLAINDFISYMVGVVDSTSNYRLATNDFASVLRGNVTKIIDYDFFMFDLDYFFRNTYKDFLLYFLCKRMKIMSFDMVVTDEDGSQDYVVVSVKLVRFGKFRKDASIDSHFDISVYKNGGDIKHKLVI